MRKINIVLSEQIRVEEQGAGLLENICRTNLSCFASSSVALQIFYII